MTKVNLWNPDVDGAEKYSRVGDILLSAIINDLDLYNWIFFLSSKTLTKYDVSSSKPSRVLFSALYTTSSPVLNGTSLLNDITLNFNLFVLNSCKFVETSDVITAWSRFFVNVYDGKELAAT